MGRLNCITCFAQEALELRMHKKGGYWTSCVICGTRTFLRGATSLRGVFYWSKALSENNAAELAGQADALAVAAGYGGGPRAIDPVAAPAQAPAPGKAES